MYGWNPVAKEGVLVLEDVQLLPLLGVEYFDSLIGGATCQQR